MNLTRFSQMLIRLKKKNNNTIVKRITFEISVWSNTSTKPSAFNMITQARRTVHVFTAVLQQACASCETGDPDFLYGEPTIFVYYSMHSPRFLLQSSICSKIHLLILLLLLFDINDNRVTYFRINVK